MCFYLDAQDSEGNNVWLEWSKKNPKLAAVLWPAVAKVCRQELYLFVPELLALASSEASLERLGGALNTKLTERYCELATAHQRLKRHETAVELFSEGLRCTPASIPALKGRAASLQATGKVQEAATDLAEVARLQGLSGVEPRSRDAMKLIYLDNNSTTPLLPEVIDAMRECHSRNWANPASQHQLGRRARQALEDAREGIAEILGASRIGSSGDQLVFTSGGTEANNLALFGITNGACDRLLVSSVEHPSVLRPAEELARLGTPVVRLSVDRAGRVQLPMPCGKRSLRERGW